MSLAREDRGTGAPIVFIHGFPHNRSLWDGQVAALSNDWRCIAPDLRGFGESAGPGPASIDAHGDDIAALLDEVGIERAVITGLSMGGYVALAMWRRHRHRVRALVLCDTRAGADSPEARSKRDGAILLARREGMRAVADSQITGMVGKTTRENSPELVAAVHSMLAAAPVEGVVAALQALRDRPDSTSMLPTISVPVLIVVGDEDVITPVKESQQMHELIPGSALQVIHGAGHLSNVERPEDFNRALMDFLAKLQQN